MNPGPPRGAAAQASLTITPDMADPLSGDGRQVASLQSMVAVLDRTHRGLLESHLDPGEELLGDEVTFTWRSPVPVGAEVELVVTVAQVSRVSVMSEVVARRDGRMVARGTHRVRVLAPGAFASEVAQAN